jgi:hypothetical protein
MAVMMGKGLMDEINRIARLRETEGRGEYADISHKLGSSKPMTYVGTPRDPGKSTAMDVLRAREMGEKIRGMKADRVIFDEVGADAFKKEAFGDFMATDKTSTQTDAVQRRGVRKTTCERVGKEWPHLRGRGQEIKGVSDNWFTVTEQLSEILHKSNFERGAFEGKHPESYRSHVTGLVDKWTQANHDDLIEWIRYCDRKAASAYLLPVAPVDDPVTLPDDLVDELEAPSESAAVGIW